MRYVCIPSTATFAIFCLSCMVEAAGLDKNVLAGHDEEKPSEPLLDFYPLCHTS